MMIDQNDQTFMHVRIGKVFNKLVLEIVEYDGLPEFKVRRRGVIVETNDSMMKVLNDQKYKRRRDAAQSVFDYLQMSAEGAFNKLLSDAPDKKYRYDLNRAEKRGV